MKIAKPIILLVIACIVVLSIQAEDKTTIRLSDGSTLTGKIIVQRPGKDITIAAEKASFVVDAANLKSLRSKKVKYEELAREWKRWALEKKKLQGNANGRYLVFNEVTTKNYVFSDVVKIENAKEPKETYEQIVPNKYNIRWSDIAAIKHSVSTTTNKKSIDDEVTTTKGKTYQGVIVNQQLEKALTLKRNLGGAVRTQGIS